MQAGKARLISHATMTMRRNGVGNGLAADSGNGRFARRINIGDDDAIRLIEGSAKFLSQSFGPGVAVRLKHGQHAIAPSRTCRGQGRTNFWWVMGIVIDQDEK